MLRPGQRAAVLGIGGLGHLAIPIAKAMGADPLPIITVQLLAYEKRIIGIMIGTRLDFQEHLRLAVQHNFRPITECYTLDDVNTAHARLREGKVRYRAVLTPN